MRFNIVILFLLISCELFSQIPQSINYQAIARDGAGNPIVAGTVDLRFTIITGVGNFVETHLNEPVSSFGLVNVQIGSQNTIDFATIEWDATPVSITVEIDDGGGFNLIGNQDLYSVPYSFQALVADSVRGVDLSVSGTSEWAVSGGDINRLTGNVGIRTNTPLSPLQIGTDFHVLDKTEVGFNAMTTNGVSDGAGSVNYQTNNGVSIMVLDPTLSGFFLYDAGTAGTEVSDYNMNLKVTPTGVGIKADGINATLDMADNTDGIILPVGTSLERPGLPEAGLFRYNSDLIEFEGYNGGSWVSFGPSQWAVNGSDINRLTGNVGIGTTTPDYTLDVAGDVGVDEFIRHNGDLTTYIRMQVSRFGLKAGDAALNLSSNSLEANYTGTTFSVMANTSLVQQTKDVLTLVHFTDDFANPNLGQGSGVLFQGVDTGKEIEDIARIAGVFEKSANTEEYGYLSFQTRENGGALTEGMVLSSAGNVGIGTNGPLEALHVVGNIRMEDGNQALGYVLTSNANGVGSWAPSPSSPWSSGSNTIYTTSDRVGIGTSSVNYDLDVRSSSDAILNISSSGSGIGTEAGVRFSMFDSYTGTQYYAYAEKDNATANSGSSDFVLRKDFSTGGGYLKFMKYENGTNNVIINESKTAAVAFGDFIVANGNVGIGTSATSALLTIDGGVLASGTTGGTPVSGGGTRMMWIPSKSAFRAGRVTTTQWDDVNIGTYSFASGSNSTASGAYSTALGNNSTASGTSSFAAGISSQANGDYAVALGNSCEANGLSSVALGSSADANGDYSVAIGRNINSSAQGTFSIRDATTGGFNNGTNNRFMALFSGGYSLYSNATFSAGVNLAAGGTSWQVMSDSTLKENFSSVKSKFLLDQFSEMKLGTWNYVANEDSIRHYGPMAQDFDRIFGDDGIGHIGSDTTITTQDISGVNMTLLQALLHRSDQKDKELEDKINEYELLLNKNEEQEDLINKLKAELDSKTQLIEERLRVLEVKQSVGVK